MEPKEKLPAAGPAGRTATKPPANPEMEEFFARFHEQMSMAKPGETPIATAMHAIRELSFESDAEESAEPAAISQTAASGITCNSCGARNRHGHRFCSTCGVPLEEAKDAKAGQHFYHHHYHHHYVSANGAPAPATENRVSTPSAPKEFARPRAAAGGAFLSRAETAARQVAQNWALACNTKQIDDLMDLYTADALLLRANVPPIRSMASVREFFVSALGSGLGEVEMEVVRFEMFGETAYEAGRCKMLVPTVAGKRREERGKYLLFLVRQAEGEWKIAVDCWSSDLGLDK